jgi:hypothetical protein
MVWDLADKPEETKRARDEDGNLICPTAMVMTAFGGGHNYGELRVPQINEKGLVSSIRGSITDFVWLGSFFSEVAQQPRLVSVVIDDMVLEIVKPNDKDKANMDKTPNATTKLADTTSTPLSFTGTVRTYRYLSDEEEEEQAKIVAAEEAERAKKDKKAARKPNAPTAPKTE